MLVFSRQNTVIIEHDMIVGVSVVTWLVQLNMVVVVVVVYLDPGLNGLFSLANIHFAALTEDAICAWRFEAPVVFHRNEQPGDIPGW